MKNLLIDSVSDKIVVLAENNEKAELLTADALGTKTLMPTIDKALKKVGLKINAVENLVVCIGPGSWTGERVGVATVLGLLAGMNKTDAFVYSTFDRLALAKGNGASASEALAVRAYAKNVYVKTAKTEALVSILEANKLGVKFFTFEDLGLENQTVLAENVKENLMTLMHKVISEGKPVDASALEPKYLRESQAELQLKEKQKSANN